MRKKWVSIILLLALLAMIHYNFNTATVYAQNTTVVRIIPESTILYTTSVNQTFKVAVVAENVTNFYGFDIQLNWTTDYIRYVNHTVTVPVESYPAPNPPSPYPGALHNPVLPVKEEVNENGVPLANPGTMAWFAKAAMAPAQPQNGSVTIAVITFKIVQAPVLNADIQIHIVSSDLSDVNASPITHEEQDLHFTISEIKQHVLTVDNVNYTVVTESNSTVSTPTVSISDKMLQFNVTGPDGTVGYCNVTVPKNFMWTATVGDWMVLVDGQQVQPQISEDNVNTYIYLTYNQSTHTIQIKSTNIVPEFNQVILILILAGLAITMPLILKSQRSQRFRKISHHP